MSFFKQQLMREIEQVFLNPLEFGEELIIDGIPRIAVIDDTQGGFATRSHDGLNNASGIGLVQNSRTLYLKDDGEFTPVPEEILDINGEQWMVEADTTSVRYENGMLVLRIARIWS